MFGSPFQRSLVLIGAALALPIITLVVLQVAFSLNRERDDVERATMARAEQVNMLVDARVQADLAAMHVLASSTPLDQLHWRDAYERAREVASFNPDWRGVILSDLDTHTQIFDTSRPFAAQQTSSSPLVETSSPNGVGGIVRNPDGYAYAYLQQRLPNAPRYVLTVTLTPSVFQSILLSITPPGSVTALVDRDGRFIARSLDYDARLGLPATHFVSDALRRAPEGYYHGKTYEGFENYTAYKTSALTGWSAHIAIANQLLSQPQAYSFLAIAVGALLALALAAGLIAYALNDLAQRRRAEDRIAQAQKLEAIGQLTGGVAHDFNNLLTVIIGGLGMLLRRLEDDQSRQIAEHMLDAAKRGDKLTKQLLAFSRGQRLQLAPVDLQALVLGMEELLRRSVEPGVALDFHIDPEARWVMSDSNQLELAILNLAINARDAMPTGGHVEIATRPTPKNPNCIDLIVADNGVGMSKEVIERAAEPFFTTKPAGKGTGLGLAQVYGAVRQSGGSLDIDSTPERGTIIRMTLPRTAAPAAQAVPEEAARALDSIPARAGRSVLVVDDEPGVRTFMTETLLEAGYNALAATDVGAALARLETHPPELLLTDYSMPGMNGLELAEHARAKTPNLRVLIVSGYADAEALEKSAARPGLLRKPFDARALIEAVEAALTD